MTLTPQQKPPLMGSSGGGVIHRRRTDRQLEFHAFRTVPGLEAEFVCCLGAGTTDGEWSSRRSISVSSLRQGPIRCVARVERCCWTTSAQTTPCGYGSRLTCQTSRRHCERSEAIHREAKKKAGLLRCAPCANKSVLVVPAVIPAKAGSGTPRLSIDHQLLCNTGSPAFAGDDTASDIRLRSHAQTLCVCRSDHAVGQSHLGIPAARMRPRCARIFRLSMRRAWGMPGADAPAASHAK